MVQKTRETVKSAPETSAEEDVALKTAQEAGKTALEGISDEDIDQMLADIDDVLEENAEQFVSAFIQKGGE